MLSVLLVVLGALALVLVDLSPAAAAVRLGLAPVTSASAASGTGTFVPLAAARLLDTRLGHPGPATASHPVVTIPVLGVGGVPQSGVAMAAVTLTVVSPTAAGYVGHGLESSINFAAGQTVADLALLPVAADGSVSVTVHSVGTTQVLADLAGYVRSGMPSTSGTILTGGALPGRLVDTRQSHATIPAGTVAQLSVGSRLPFTAGALLATVTVTGTSAAGWLGTFADGAGESGTSTVNFAAGQTVANYALLPLQNGIVDVSNHSAGPVDVIVDADAAVVDGTPTSDGGVRAVRSSRVLDTRTSLGSPGPLRDQGTTRFVVTGQGGVPTTGVRAVVLNVTETLATGAGYVTAYPGGSPPPTASVLNFTGGRTIADEVVVPVGADGTVALTVKVAGTVQLVADVQGYMAALGPPPSLTVGPTTTIDPDGGGLGAVSCPGRTFCMAVLGDQVRTFDGSVWSGPTTVAMSTVTWEPSAVSCASSRFCVVLDGDSQVAMWDGTAWTVEAVPPPSNGHGLYLGSVSCPTSTFCAAVTGDDWVTTWDGHAWSVAVRAPAQLTDPRISCTSSTFCMSFSGFGEDTAETYDGTSWTPLSVPPIDAAVRLDGTALSCLASSFCLAVSTHDELDSHHQVVPVTFSRVFEGGAWRPATTVPTSTATSSYASLSCGSTTMCVLGDDGSDHVVVFDGARWSSPIALDPSVTDARTETTPGISCADAGWCLVTDRAGRVFTGADRSWAGPDTVAASTGGLTGVACAAPDRCVAVDRNGNTVTWNGESWGAPTLLGAGRVLSAITCPSADFCLTGDDTGGVFVLGPTGWGGRAVVDAGHAITAVSCWAAQQCAVGDDSGQVLVLSGTQWSTPVRVGSRSIMQMSCGSASLCAATDQSGTQLHLRQGSGWGVVPTLIGDAAVACTSSACLVGGGGGDLTRIVPGSTGPGSWWYGVRLETGGVGCTSSGLCLAAGASSATAGAIFGGPWSTPVASPPATASPSCVDPGVCAVIGPESATIVRIS